MSKEKIKIFTIEELQVGQQDQITRLVELKDILEFSKITDDYHPLHSDKKYALTHNFKDVIAHGLLLSSYSSALIGMKLPGKNTIVMKQSFEYIEPVYPNDALVITGIVNKLEKRFNFVEVGITITCKGKIMSKGSYKIKIRK